MRHVLNRKIRLWACFLTCLCAVPFVHAETLLPSQPEQDLLFLEVQRSLREEPDSPFNDARRFAMGEYLFRAHNYGSAGKYFLALEGSSLDGPQALLSLVYLDQIARDAGSGTEVLERLKKNLSDRRFFSPFGSEREELWVSPLKNQYRMVERVDCLEVYLNGSLFYRLELP